MQQLGNQVSMETDWYDIITELEKPVILLLSAPKLHSMGQPEIQQRGRYNEGTTDWNIGSVL
jgi:hypothetical protein